MKPRNVLRELDDAEPGMILSGPVLDAHGETLVAGGAELTEAMLAMLRARGLERVSVLAAPPAEGDLEAERRYAQERISQLFRNSGAQPASRELMQSVRHYRLGEGA